GPLEQFHPRARALRLSPEPGESRGHDGLSLARHERPAHRRDGGEALSSEAPDACGPSSNPDAGGHFRERRTQKIARRRAGGDRELAQTQPEGGWIPEFCDGDIAKPRMSLREYDWPASFLQRRTIPIQHAPARRPERQLQVSESKRELRAGCQPHQVLRVRELTGIVDIVDAPDQAAFFISPRAEVFHMDVADRDRAQR